MAENKYDVFISYSWNDVDIATEICSQLKEAGIKCCLDKESFRGTDFPQITANCILNSEIFLYLGSKSSFVSGWAPDEVAFAKSHKQRNKLLYYGIDDAVMPIWMDLAFAAINRRNYKEHPIGTVLVNDIKHILAGHNIETSDIRLDIVGEEFDVRVDDIVLRMIRVEGGEMLIGATPEQELYSNENEHPAHSISLNTFYISQFPVTQDLWKRIMSFNKSYFQHKENGVNICANHPAETLNHDSAKKFVQMLSRKTQLPFSLPTEEEWEFAARGGNKSKGFLFAGSNNIDEVAWYRDNSNGTTHPVGEKKPNELGLYDMSGNVWEWTESPMHWYSDEEIDNDMGVFVRKGGSFWHKKENCRVSKRYASDKSKKTKGLGLRVVIRLANQK